MQKRKSKAKTAVVPWWLSDGDEDCPHCGQPYIYEVEFRCPSCDGPSCPHCKQVHTEGHHVCPSCVDSKDHADEDHAHG